MKDVSLGKFKIISRLTSNTVHIAYKQKGGILFTVKFTEFKPIDGWGFTFYLGNIFTQVTYYVDDKGRKYLELVQPAKEEQIKLYPVDKDIYTKFVDTDYNGKQL